MRRRLVVTLDKEFEVEHCEQCPMGRLLVDGVFMCQAEGKRVEGLTSTTPEWCPLRTRIVVVAMKVEEKCLNCEFYVEGQPTDYEKERADGECRENSPQTIDSFGLGVWPSVPPTGWCGRHTPRSRKS